MKNKEKKLNKTCDEMDSILSVMRRANKTGDDVRIEIDSGINLLTALVAEMRHTKE